MDFAAAAEKLQQLRANLIANRMEKERNATKTVSGLSPLSSIPSDLKSPFIPGLSIFHQKLATPQATFRNREPSRFGEPSPPRQLQAPSLLQAAKPAQSASWGGSESPAGVFGGSQQTVFGQNASPRPPQSTETLVGPQQATQPFTSLKSGPVEPTTHEQKTVSSTSPPRPDFTPWTPPALGAPPAVKLPPSDERAVDFIPGNATAAVATTDSEPMPDQAQTMAVYNDPTGEANMRSDALVPVSKTPDQEDLPDLDIWLEITGYHDVKYRETTIQKHKAEKMVAERRKALEDAQAELDRLLQKPVKSFGFTSRLGTPAPRQDNDGPSTATYSTITAPQASTGGAKRARTPSPSMDPPAKRHDNRGDSEQTKPLHETDFGRHLTFPDTQPRASSYYRSSTRPSLPDVREREPSERPSPRRRQKYDAYGPYRGDAVSDRDIDRVVREQQAAKYRRLVNKATNTSDSEHERK
ncbi:hypothetical protein MBLNU457_6723t1 [Dothideomycetes sp. NU457]